MIHVYILCALIASACGHTPITVVLEPYEVHVMTSDGRFISGALVILRATPAFTNEHGWIRFHGMTGVQLLRVSAPGYKSVHRFVGPGVHLVPLWRLTRADARGSDEIRTANTCLARPYDGARPGP